MWRFELEVMCSLAFSDIMEESGSKEFSFGIATPTRTYHLTASNNEEKKYEQYVLNM